MITSKQIDIFEEWAYDNFPDMEIPEYAINDAAVKHFLNAEQLNEKIQDNPSGVNNIITKIIQASIEFLECIGFTILKRTNKCVILQ